MRRNEKIGVWNHTMSGKMVAEGIATLVRKDAEFEGVTPPEVLSDQPGAPKDGMFPDIEPKAGAYERWQVQFDGDGDDEDAVSRWVRKEDVAA